jgi:hypothetical protein
VPASSNHASRRPWSLWILVGLLIFLGLFAVAPGYTMIIDPSGARLGMTTDLLSNPMFPTYLIPGLFLFLVIGLGSLVVATALLVRPKWHWVQAINPIHTMEWEWTASLLLGVCVMLWIVIQVVSVVLYSWLQPVIFGVGLAITLLTLEPHMRRYFARPASQSAQAT